MSDDLVRRYQMVGQYTEWSMAQVDGDDVDYSSKTEWVKATDHAAALLAKDAEIARLAEMLIESASWLEGTGNSGPMGYAKTIRAALENRDG